MNALLSFSTLFISGGVVSWPANISLDSLHIFFKGKRNSLQTPQEVFLNILKSWRKCREETFFKSESIFISQIRDLWSSINTFGTRVLFLFWPNYSFLKSISFVFPIFLYLNQRKRKNNRISALIQFYLFYLRSKAEIKF